MATYKPLQLNETPSLGTSGSAVLAIQKELNKNGAGLKEDALYGPLTAAAYAKYNTPVNTITGPTKSTFIEPTLASYESDPNYKYAQDINTKLMKGEDIVDTNKIRSDTLAGFQDRINSLNSIYAQKMTEAKQQGVGRVGQTTAILANRGLAGSARGGAIAEGTLTQNRQIEDAISNEQAVAIANLYGKADEIAVNEAQRRREAIEGGAKSYIEFVKNQEVSKKDNLGNLAGAFITQGIDPSTMTQDEIKSLADKLKVSPSDIISTYKQKQYEKQQADIKANPNKELSQGEALYVFNPETGKYEQQGYNPKTSVKTGTSGSVSGVSSSNSYKNDLDAIIGATLVTIPSKFGQEQFNTQLNRTRNDADKINLIASTVLKNSPNEIKTDFSNQSIAVSNIDKAISEIDKGAKTGVINNALQKGFNLFGKDYDPALQSVAAYIVSAVQPYRNSVTGAAWGSQEENEYQQLFGSTAFSPAELKQRLERLKGIMVNKSVQGLNTFVNPLNTYANPFAPVNIQSPVSPAAGTVTVYSVKTGKSAQIPAGSLQQALSSGLFKQ